MRKFLKGGFIFSLGIASGFVCCGILTVKKVIEHEELRKAAIKVAVDKAIKIIFKEEQNNAGRHFNNSNIERRRYG